MHNTTLYNNVCLDEVHLDALFLSFNTMKEMRLHFQIDS